MAKMITAAEAAALIQNESTVAVSGFVGSGHPEALSEAVEKRFLADGAPRGLTLLYSAGQGDGKGRGLGHFAHRGLVRRVVGGHWNWAPELGRMAVSGEIEAYNLPQGVITQLFRAAASGQPGVITRTGLGTFVDPRLEGGRLNDRSPEPLVELLELDGEEYLRYRPLAPTVALLRASAADGKGNLSDDREAVRLEILSMAQAVKSSGGVVIAQVAELRDRIPPRGVTVPGMLVDYVVVAPAELHRQTYATQYSAVFAGYERADLAQSEPLAPDWRRIVARRALMEIADGSIINLGIGAPEAVARAALEAHRAQKLTLTVEAGGIGGVPAGGLDFGAVYNAEAMMEHTSQFDLYDGGCLDVSCLGFAQADASGSVNVSKFNGRVAGCGGFIDISQNAKKLIFCGSFTTGGFSASSEGGRLRIEREGRIRKFVSEIEQVTFSGPYAASRGQEVLFVTERALFRLGAEGLVLEEIAPGAELERDVLGQMEFRPVISPSLREMPAGVFA